MFVSCGRFEAAASIHPASMQGVKSVPNWSVSAVEANEVISFPSFPLFLNYIAKRSINIGKSLAVVKRRDTFNPGFREMSVSPH